MSKISEDLVLIRKEKRLSKQNVYEKCRVPLETIYAIEDGSIFSGKTRNKTYLRSYIRTYAKALGISDGDMIRALDEYEEGRYKNSLLEKYLPEQVETTDQESVALPGEDEDAEKNGSQEKTAEGKKSLESRDSESTRGSKENKGSESKKSAESGKSKAGSSKKSYSITPESQEKTLQDIEWEDESLKSPTSTSTSEFASSEAIEPETGPVSTPEPPDLGNVDWATKVKHAVYRPQPNRVIWIIIAMVLALALAITAVYWYWQQDTVSVTIEAPTEETAPAAPEDAITTDETPDPEVSEAIDEAETEAIPGTPEDVVLPGEELETDAIDSDDPQLTVGDIANQFTDPAVSDNTIYVYVYALHGNLEPIRVHSDVFLTETVTLQPYWVEHEEAMRFDFIDEIIFQGALSRMVLIVNGHVIDDFSELYTDEGPRIQLTRNFLMENEQFHSPAASPFSDLPEPESVVDRPRFTP